MSNRLPGSHLHSLPLRRHVSPYEAKTTGLDAPTKNLHRGMMHSQSVVDPDPVVIERVLGASRQSNRDPGNDGEESRKSRRLFGENL